MPPSPWLAHLTVGRHITNLWDSHPDQLRIYEVQPPKPSTVSPPPNPVASLTPPTEPGTRYRVWARVVVEDPFRGRQVIYFTQGFLPNPP